MKALKIVFMGTPEFALPSLDLLQLSSHRLLGVVVPPDRPMGRGGKVNFVAVKKWALMKGIEIWQPEKLTGQKPFYEELKKMDPDLIITAAYGKLLPNSILQLPKFGCINLHASYLPYYRGPAPIHRAIIDGASFSGVTVIKMIEELDAGDIIMREKEDISPFDTTGMLHDRLAARGASLLLKAVNALAEGTETYTPQEHSSATYAPPLQREDEKLNWHETSLSLYNRIRGLNPWPGAYTTCKGKRIKVWKAAYPEEKPGRGIEKPGIILAVSDQSLTVSTGDGSITLLELQPAGKKCMDAGSFCCGYRVEAGDRLNGEKNL